MPEVLIVPPDTDIILVGTVIAMLVTVPDVNVCHVLSPRKNFVLSAVPLPRKEAANVPLVILLVASAGMSLASRARKAGVPVDANGAAKT